MPRITVRITSGFTEQVNLALTDLSRRLDPAALTAAIKTAVSQSFLANIGKRYAAAENDMNMQRRISNRRLTGQLTQKDRERLANINAKVRGRLLKVAQVAGPSDITKVRDILKVRDRILSSYQRSKYTAKKQKDSRGKRVHQALREAAKQRLVAMRRVRDLITAKDQMEVEYGRRNGVINSITVKAGRLDQLDRIRTPSATPLITGHQSSSRFNILWRQMEFGTGVFAFPSGRFSGRYKTSAGTWWFGPRVGQGVHFAGNRPGQFLRQKTGQLYTADAMLFEQRLRKVFS